MTLRSLLGKYDRKLRKYCKQQLRQGVKKPSAVWVCDNYPACSSGLKAAIGYLSQKGEKELMPLFLMCKDFIEETDSVSAESIVRRFSREKLSIRQADALYYLLFAACSAVIVDKKDNEETVISAVKKLLKLRESDFTGVLYGVSKAERFLCDDPDGVYEKMDAHTKAVYREAVIKGAKKEGIDECSYVSRVLDMAEKDEKRRHIGFFLPVKADRTTAATAYIASEWLISIVLSVLLSFAVSGRFGYSLLLLLPLYAVLKPLSDKLCARLFRAEGLLSMDEEYITDCSTLITVSSVLPSASAANGLYGHLSRLYSSNTGKNVKVMLLLDMKNSKEPETIADETDKAAVGRVIDRLNKKYGGGFSAAVRDRVYSPSENEYTGFERKRGAINALMKYLRDKNCGVFSELYGDTRGLENMKYVLALDSDTSMSFEVLKTLVAAAEHPLNRPVYDPVRKRITKGYGIISPRVETSVDSAGKTVFSGLFTAGGSVLYCPTVSERYTDMFGTGIFSGKGLISVDAFNKAVTDKFDDNRILSHDILEGGVLRTAFMPRAELTDSFPASPDSYFTRLHRWIRGDVQNLKYIVSPLGKNASSPSMPPVGKYQLADNFRRAVTPVISLVLLVLSCFMPYYSALLFLFTALFSVTSGHIVSVVSSFIKGGFRIFSALYFSSDIPNPAKEVLRGILALGSLPEQAFFSIDAVIRALYRSIVSKKKLLQWVPAADSEKAGNRNRLFSLILPVLCGSVLYIQGNSLHRLIAFFVFIFIPLGISDGIKRQMQTRKPLTENESQILSSFAARHWKFFEENVSPLENWLPPDNIQETPVYAKARRTSPTNIGFYLVSILAAADMFFISPDEMVRRINDTLTSVERLPKFRGLLYNWYDTVKMTPLSPSYVSSVDCGNFLACLIALKEGLYEYNEYSQEIRDLCLRIEKLIEMSDLSILYDRTRKLFRIGIDCESGEPSSSYYDLYMSEARLTSYTECALRHVPISHWMSLARSLKRSGNYVTAVSWTGTLFEYFMPLLFIPAPQGTFQYEALKTALYMQKKRCMREGIPYGISESGFYAVDNSLNYRYKAHGLKKLALKREADEESVISPYSVFLTLPFDTKSAMKNLSHLSSLHCEGRYGFYEAVDFTPSRTEGEDYNIVRSYMSHHVGMSIVAVANTLLDDIFVKRFMSDEKMGSAGILLEEKLPEHPFVLRQPSDSFIERKYKGSTKKNDSLREDTDSDVIALSNGDVTVFADKWGRSRCVFSGYEIYRYSERTKGLSVAVMTEDETLRLFPSDENGAVIRSNLIKNAKETEKIRAVSSICVHPSGNALLVPVRVTNNSSERAKIKVCWYSEPLFLPFGEYERHPAFSDMFIKCERIEKKNALCVSRKNSSSPTAVFSLYGKHRAVFNTDRERVIGRMTDMSSVFDADYNTDGCDTEGIYPAVAVSTTLEIGAGKSEECVLVVAFAQGKNNALHCLSKVMSGALPDINKGRPASFMRDPITADTAKRLISDMCFASPCSENIILARKAFIGTRNDLWKTGISGDIPVFTVFAQRECSESIFRAFVKLHRRLLNCSVMTDLVFIFDSNRDYGFSGDTELMRVIKEESSDGFLGVKGGIHILYAPSITKKSLGAVLAFSSAMYPDKGKCVPLSYPYSPDVCREYENTLSENGFSRNGFVIGTHPHIPWSHTLSNRSFGTLLTDRSLGFSWAYNSGLNKLTRWSGDIRDEMDGERLFLKADDRIFDIIASSVVSFSPSSAEYRFYGDGVSAVTRVRVPSRGARKELSVNVSVTDGKHRDVQLFYCVFPFLGETRTKEEIIKITKGKNIVSAKNFLCSDYEGVMAVGSSDGNSLTSDSTAVFFGYDKRCMGILQKFAVNGNNMHNSQFFTVFGKNENTVQKTAFLPFDEKEEIRPVFNTPYPFFNAFASSLLYHQTADTRLDARTGFWQCSGAWGYRDQLQDSLALIGRNNRRVKQIIFRMASAQFISGDVLHWFHTAYRKGLIYKGVRTRCSDDMLWLVYTASRYVLETGDSDILFRKIPFLAGEPLSEGQKENYGEYTFSDKKDTLFVHCLAAISKSFTSGEHGLPLIGTGDWNDSFSAVGEKGRGESVWLGMFIRKTLSLFAKVCDMINEDDVSVRLRKMISSVTSAIEKNAWNGEWYIRGFYDDGTPLGDKGAESCETDLITAAWSVLSEMPDKSRRRKALMSAYNSLFDEKNGVVKLFTPPFNENSRFTGYVNFYPEGVRENGGQYTHAAVWFCMALFMEGFTEEGEKVLKALIPSEKYRDGRGDIYKTEPYALAGDVYSLKGHVGRGGWSLYTGSAGWMIQLADMLDE